jgi:electron transport complex protein RnfG
MSDKVGFKDSSLGMVLALTVTAIIVGGGLAAFYGMVEPRIEANRLAEEKRAIFSVINGAADYEVIEVLIELEDKVSGTKVEEPVKMFRGMDDNGATVGIAFIADTPGFAANIRMMVGLNIDRKTLSGLKVIEQIETPGLGNKIAFDKFQDQFKGLHIDPQIEYIKNVKPTKPNVIQAITGATISCKAVVVGINKQVRKVLMALALAETEYTESLREQEISVVSGVSAVMTSNDEAAVTDDDTEDDDTEDDDTEDETEEDGKE